MDDILYNGLQHTLEYRRLNDARCMPIVHPEHGVLEWVDSGLPGWQMGGWRTPDGFIHTSRRRYAYALVPRRGSE